MNIIILNDTSKYHYGSNHVINFLKDNFKEHNVTLCKKTKEHLLRGNDILVINGEGTMHDDAKKAKTLIDLAVYAKQELSMKVMLVNSVWQRNNEELTEKLKMFDYVSVREILSKQEINNVIDIPVDVNLDFSYYLDVPYQSYPTANIVAGNYYVAKSKKEGSVLISGIGEDSTIDIFNEEWNTVVNKLRHARVLVTGRHHEMYAACKAECPFIVMEGNTHKNSGLFKTFNVNIPVLPIDTSNDDIKDAISNLNQYTEEYKKLFRLMKSKSIPSLLQKI